MFLLLVFFSAFITSVFYHTILYKFDYYPSTALFVSIPRYAQVNHFLSPAWLVSPENHNPYNIQTREIIREFEAIAIPVGAGNVNQQRLHHRVLGDAVSAVLSMAKWSGSELRLSLCQGFDLLRETAGTDIIERYDIDVQRICPAPCNGAAVFG